MGSEEDGPIGRSRSCQEGHDQRHDGHDPHPNGAPRHALPPVPLAETLPRLPLRCRSPYARAAVVTRNECLLQQPCNGVVCHLSGGAAGRSRLAVVRRALFHLTPFDSSKEVT